MSKNTFNLTAYVFPDALKVARIFSNLSYKEVANFLDIPLEKYKDLEEGRFTSLPSDIILMKLSTLYGTYPLMFRELAKRYLKLCESQKNKKKHLELV